MKVVQPGGFRFLDRLQHVQTAIESAYDFHAHGAGMLLLVDFAW
jgi:hypothetical protein